LLVVVEILITFQPPQKNKIHLNNMFEPSKHTDTFPLEKKKRKEKRKKKKNCEKKTHQLLGAY
jgi:hypothetical protein